MILIAKEVLWDSMLGQSFWINFQNHRKEVENPALTIKNLKNIFYFPEKNLIIAEIFMCLLKIKNIADI